MSYLNFKLYKLEPQDLYYLLSLKQVEGIVIPQDTLIRFSEQELVKSIKGKKGDSEDSKLRLSDKGKKLLVNLSFEGAPDEETESLVEWLVKLFKNRSGGIIKNKVETKRRLQWFKTETQIFGNYLAILIQSFINDTYSKDLGMSVEDFMEQNERGVLNNILDNVFWKPESVFDKHKTLEKSPLFQYYEDNEEYVKQIWNNRLDENGNRK
jgi:hypothetical protein